MIPTQASIRKAYVEEYLKRRQDAEEFARFTESKLADFIRKHESPNFESIYTQLDHNFYDRVRHDMAIDGQMRTEDNAADNRYSLHLKTWSGFLESKAFRNLFKTKIAIEDLSSDAELSAPSTPSFREETEGDRGRSRDDQGCPRNVLYELCDQRRIPFHKPCGGLWKDQRTCADARRSALRI